MNKPTKEKVVAILNKPKACIWCPFYRENTFEGWCVYINKKLLDKKTSKYLSNTFKSKECQLNPLPQGHGDLIDRQALIESATKKGSCDWYDEIKNAPTVIEAESEKQGMQIVKIYNPYFEKEYKVAEGRGDIEYTLINIRKGKRFSSIRLIMI